MWCDGNPDQHFLFRWQPDVVMDVTAGEPWGVADDVAEGLHVDETVILGADELHRALKLIWSPVYQTALDARRFASKKVKDPLL